MTGLAMPAIGKALMALGLAVMLLAAGPAASGEVAGIGSIRDLAGWLAPRLAAAEAELAARDRVVQARLADQALATARLAGALQRNAALLTAKRALAQAGRQAAAHRDAADEVARRLDQPAAEGLMVLAARGRHDPQPPGALGRLRAVVGTVVAPYFESVRQSRLLDGEAGRLAAEAEALDARLAGLGAELSRLDGQTRRSTGELRAAQRERDEAGRRRDALARQLAGIEVLERLALPADGTALGGWTARLPQQAPAAPALLARLPDGHALPELRATARAGLGAGAGALVRASLRAGDPSHPAGDGGLFAPIAGRLLAAGGEEAELFRAGRLIETGVPQRVSAPWAGTVVFADRFKGFGLLLIIDRGDGYHALLSGFSRLDVNRGASVTAGQAVGAIGIEGGVARLYMELRRHGIPIDPAAWTASRENRVRS